MKHIKYFLILCMASLLLFGCSPASSPDADVASTAAPLADHTLKIFCGAGMTKPFQEIADQFSAETGCTMELTFANAAQIQNQINTAQEGALFVAGSAEELKPVEAHVTAQRNLVKHIPVLAVQAGNPKNISGLSDLTRADVSLLVGDAASTPIGKIAAKALEKAGITDQVHILANTTTAPAMATALANQEADAAIVWKENCDDPGVEIVDCADLEPFIKVVPAATLAFCEDQEALEAFLIFLDTDAAKEIWQRYGYVLAQ